MPATPTPDNIELGEENLFEAPSKWNGVSSPQVPRQFNSCSPSKPSDIGLPEMHIPQCLIVDYFCSKHYVIT